MVNGITKDADKTAAWKRDTTHWARSQSPRDGEKEMKQGKEKMNRNCGHFSRCAIWLERWTEVSCTKLNEDLSNVTTTKGTKKGCVTMGCWGVCGKGQNLERSRRLGAPSAWARLGCSTTTPD